VVVSKKVSRQAVARNHLRRQLHHLVKAHFPHQTLPLDLVIVTKPLSITLDHTQLEALITQFTNHIKSHVYTS
jgi:ribonuclease P protein component